MITGNDLLDLWNKVPCVYKILYLDTCDAGSFLKEGTAGQSGVTNDPAVLSSTEQALLGRLGKSIGNTFVASSYYYTGRPIDSYAADGGDDSGLGAFASVAVRGIGSGAPAYGGKVTAWGLEGYIYGTLPTEPTLNTLYQQRAVTFGPWSDFPFLARP